MFDLEKTDSGQKVNAFIDIKGVPYLCGYYLNNISFQTLSATQVQNEISIDNTIEGRTLVNIELDQLDHDDQGLILPTGNVEKREQLEQMIMNYRDYIGLNSFEVLKNGLVVQINYRIEDQVTGRVVKVMTDSYTIYNAGFYSFVGDTNIADPAVIIKFSDSAVAAINQFSYGIQNLVLRINSIHLYYASVPSVRKRRPLYYPPHYAYGYPVPSPAYSRDPRLGCKVNEYRNDLYRFGNNNKDIFVNLTEIENEHDDIRLVPCGARFINKAFAIAPMQRVLFKFTVWKNDLTIVPDTYRIANILGIYSFDSFDRNSTHFANSVLNELEQQRLNDFDRDEKIKMLYEEINQLRRERDGKNWVRTKNIQLPPELCKERGPICNCCGQEMKKGQKCICHCPPPPPPPIEHHHCHCGHDHAHFIPEEHCECCHEPQLDFSCRPNLFINDIDRIVDENWVSI